jgi:cobalt-zinc-cadmium efflux system membrane fusion protein
MNTLPTIIVTLICVAALITSCNQKNLPGQQTQTVPTNAASFKTENENKDLQECEAHKAPKSICFICNPLLRDKSRLWCKEHNRYEDRCFICHPETQDKTRLYCSEHGLYEDECMICHPEIVKENKK